MKGLLLDQGLPRSTILYLSRSGINSSHVAEHGLSRASDAEILDCARERSLIVVTLDADFHSLLAATGANSPSVIRLRQQGLNGEQTASVIATVVRRNQKVLETGAVISVTHTLVRVKLLPLPRPSKVGLNS
jgi:predicted nuclease of predicted toxin-antitoxin system